MRAFAPLPIRDDWTPVYLRARHDNNLDYAFNLTDPQGAPANDGTRRHGAVDWFAPGRCPVRSPVNGRLHRVSASRGTTGQVFGGVVEIIEPDGTTWVMRHVDPLVSIVGAPIPAGVIVGVVTPWRDGGPHLHLEIWRTPTGGYRHENMIDPREVEWLEWPPFVTQEHEPEPLPHDGTLRLVLRGVSSAGWELTAGRLKWIAKHGLRPETEAAIAWRGAIWRGPRDVTHVARHLVKKYL